jgi:protein TonB
MRSPDEVLTNEAMRVLKSSPKWVPGYDKGKPVRVKYTIPIKFQL